MNPKRLEIMAKIMASLSDGEARAGPSPWAAFEGTHPARPRSRERAVRLGRGSNGQALHGRELRDDEQRLVWVGVERLYGRAMGEKEL